MNARTRVQSQTMLKPAVRIETLRRCWIHSLVTAILTEESARACGSSADSAYTAGLLHNLDDRSVESYPIEHFRGRMVYAIRHEATTLDPVGGGAESTGGPPAVS